MSGRFDFAVVCSGHTSDIAEAFKAQLEAIDPQDPLSGSLINTELDE